MFPNTEHHTFGFDSQNKKRRFKRNLSQMRYNIQTINNRDDTLKIKQILYQYEVKNLEVKKRFP